MSEHGTMITKNERFPLSDEERLRLIRDLPRTCHRNHKITPILYTEYKDFAEEVNARTNGEIKTHVAWHPTQLWLQCRQCHWTNEFYFYKQTFYVQYNHNEENKYKHGFEYLDRSIVEFHERSQIIKKAINKLLSLEDGEGSFNSKHILDSNEICDTCGTKLKIFSYESRARLSNSNSFYDIQDLFCPKCKAFTKTYWELNGECFTEIITRKLNENSKGE
jgi:hypothetical protein